MSNVRVLIRSFDSSNKQWSRDVQSNILFLQGSRSYAALILEKRGYLFLNEVYDMLGMDRSREGAACGWVSNANTHVNSTSLFDWPISDSNGGVKIRFYVSDQLRRAYRSNTKVLDNGA